MPSEYTPTTEEIEAAYTGNDEQFVDGFYRWLAQVKAEAAAQAWDEGFEAGATWPQHTAGGTPVDPPVNPYRKEQVDAD